MPASSPSALASSRTLPGEILALPQLAIAELEAVARLESACRRSDGGRLKLEWPSLRRREPAMTSDFVCVVSEEVVGFAGLYQWRPEEAEVCGMVHPDWRRRGIGRALLDVSISEASARKVDRLLMVVDTGSGAGSTFASSSGACRSFSEYRMQQRRQPEHRGRLRAVRSRQARAEDVAFVASCLAAAFGDKDGPDEQQARALIDRTLVIEDESCAPVGVMRVEREAAAASIYGFAVLPEQQHSGIGRAALCSVTTELHRSGVGVVSLEVESSNRTALGLYESCGFDVIGTEDYYLVPLEGSRSASS